jgi:hypothetical protein
MNEARLEMDTACHLWVRHVGSAPDHAAFSDESDQIFAIRILRTGVEPILARAVSGVTIAPVR